MLGTADRVVPARVACAAMIQQDDGGMDHASSLISQGARPAAQVSDREVWMPDCAHVYHRRRLQLDNATGPSPSETRLR